MSNATMALAIVGMGLITYGIRLSLFLLPAHIELPSWLLRALRYVPAAVLSAIILPEMLLPGGSFDLSPGNERLLAGLIAVVVAWRTRNVLWTVVAGMVALWLLQAFSPF
jgi:branched-subunit amino acid transport protein